MKTLLTRAKTELTAGLAAAAAALLFLSCFCGCFLVGSVIDGAEEDSSSYGLPTAAPATPKPTAYYPQNPVFLLFEEYFEARSAAGAGLLLSAAESADPEAAPYYAELCSREAELTLIYATVGMLTADGSGFSGSFTGTYAGSGTMSSRGVFAYEYENGSAIYGSLSGGLLKATTGTLTSSADLPSASPTAEASGNDLESEEPDSSPAFNTEAADTDEPASEPTPGVTAEPTAEPTPQITLENEAHITLRRTESGWIYVIERDGTVFITEVNDGALYFTRVESSALPHGFEPLNGIAGVSAASIGSSVLKYREGTLVLLKP